MGRWALLLMVFGAGCRRAAPPDAPPADSTLPTPQAELLCEVSAIRAGDSITAAIRVKPEPGWHTYWINPGDAGAPLTVTWHLPEGVTAGPLEWPAPERLEEDGLVSFAYERELVCLVTLTTPAGLPAGTNLEVRASLSWMVCKDVCVPHDAELSVRINVGDASKPGDEVAVAVIEEARSALPVVDTDWKIRAIAAEGAVQLRVTPPTGVDAGILEQAVFFPEARGVIDYAQAAQWVVSGGIGTLALARSGGVPEAGPWRGLLVLPAGEDGVRRALVVATELEFLPAP